MARGAVVSTRKHQSLMRIKTLFAISLALALGAAGYAQTLDKAKLDQFFDRLAEKNKAMGSLTIAKDGNVLYTRAIGYSQINGTEKKPLTAANRFRIASITKMFTAGGAVRRGFSRRKNNRHKMQGHARAPAQSENINEKHQPNFSCMAGLRETFCHPGRSRLRHRL